MKKFLTIIAFLSLAVAMHAQDSLYVYHHGGQADSLCMSKVTQISHSRVDLDNVCHDDYVVMSVAFSDAPARQYLLATLDSVVMVRGTERYPLVCFSGSMLPKVGQKAPRRTSLDGDFMAQSGTVNFYWTTGDKIYLEGDNSGADSVSISESHRSAEFFFKNADITDEEVVVYYPGQTPQSYNEVQVATTQSQLLPNNTDHIAIAGDCGTAVATKTNGEQFYRFELQHKASYLCFLPSIGNKLGRTVLKKITVRSDSAIAGVFTLDPTKNAIVPKSDTTHVITLTTGGESGFVLPQRAAQSTSAYMVIAPQNGSTRLTCEFTVYDTALQSEGVFTKIVDLAAVEPNMVYVVKANCNNYVVDLGLPVKFLNHNMAADAPETYGGYYAYGELEDKGYFTQNNYAYQNTSYSELANIRLTDKDVAHVLLAGNFSMPTSAELNMLKDSCTWVWQPSFNGTPGYKITGKNGNVLFLPAAGYYSDVLKEYDTRGCYRSSQLIATGQKKNWYLNFKSNKRAMEQSDEDIYLGESIRPVISSGMQMTDGTSVLVMTDSVQWTLNQQTAKLFGTVYGISKAKTPVEIGFVAGYKTDVTATDAVATLKAAATKVDGKYSVDFPMPKDTAYYYRAYAKDQDGNIEYGDALQFGRAYIDLGLPSHTKWANISLGTIAPYQNGSFYAWGETTTKSSYPNDATNYRWYTHGTWVEPDRLLDIQATDADAASVNWGGVWMTPSTADLQELVSNCDFAPSTMNGVMGYTITSNLNGNSLFMPLSGFFRTEYSNYTSHGYMASSSLPGITSGTKDRADYSSHLDNTTVNDWLRTDGIPVRPVYKTNATSANDKPMFIRTLVAAKQYDGETETDTLKATVRGLTGTSNTTVGFSYSASDNFATDTKVTIAKTTDGQYSYVISPTVPGERIYYRAFVCSNGIYYYGETLKVDAVGLVDLGLSVLWANVDIGAASADSHGDFYRWGATKPFLGDNSNYYTGNKDILPFSGHDTATELWGDKYRMPTLAEFRELISNCTVTEETSDNGVKGRRYTSNVSGYEGVSIFLPASGAFQYSGTISPEYIYRYEVGTQNSHWTSTNSSSDNAYRVKLGTDTGAAVNKNYGLPVRPVQEKLGLVYNNGFSRRMDDGVETDTLKGYFQNVSGTTQTVGFLLGESRVLDKDHKLSQYDITPDGEYFQQAISGLTPGKRYYFRAFSNDGDLWKYAVVDSFDVAGAVDLGLSVKWANVNIGSQNETSYGKYYQWGATEPFVHSTPQYYTECKDITPESGFDTATELWGTSWRMPTRAEWQELMDKNKCSWTWINSGYRITSLVPGYTDRSIFLPGAGYYNPTSNSLSHDYSSTSGDYWSSTYSSGYDVYFASFGSRNWELPLPEPEPRDYGFTVRPVTDGTVSVAVNTISVEHDATDFTRVSVECNANATPADATVGVLYGTSRNNLNSNAAFATTGQKGHYTVTLTGLTSGASYYYRPYIKQGSNYIATGDIKKFTTYELVDLDLPSGLLWMNLDLGADSICGNGDYYRWGAHVPYPQRGWDSHQTAAQNLTETGHDAVRNTLGSPYRLATWSEMQELASCANCDWSWTTMDGVPGYKVSSNTHPERFIFLPTTGWRNSSGNIEAQYADRGVFWSSSWYNTSPHANNLGDGCAKDHTGDDGNGIDPVNYAGFLRPVLSVISTYKAYASGSAYQLRGQVNSVWGYGGSVRVGFVYSMSPSPVVGAESSTDVTASVNQSGDYSYTLTNIGNNTIYYYKAFLFDGTNYHYGAEQSFMTMGATNSYQAVDLGLPSGTKWANMNVGAESDTEVGKFFAWGETYSKTNFSTATNEHYVGSRYNLIGEDIAGTKYDAARAIMGDIWSMPTMAQFNELCDPQYTKWEWTTENGRNGYRVTSLVEGFTNNSIFLPASGWMNGASLSADNSWGYFWLSTYYNSDEAYYSYFGSSKGVDADPRWEGFPIRGVINSGLTTTTGTAAVLTAGVDWTIGAAKATLRGKYGVVGNVSGATYGFVVGNSPDVDATTAAAADIITASNVNAAGDYSITYNYDGGVRYFRAFVKIGSNYAQGEVKSIGAPMLLDVAFAADGTAGNYAFTSRTCVKHGSPVVTYNTDYKRYEADFSANTFNDWASHYYSVYYHYDNDFMARLMDGHTLEAVVKVPYLKSTGSSDFFASYENGGSGLGIRSKTFAAQFYVNNGYRSAYDPDDLDDRAETYYHVVGVYDKASASVKLYVDGELVATVPASGDHTMPSTTAARYYMVGGAPDYRGYCDTAWNGSIVFTRIYDDALTASQVKTLYDNLKK